MSPSVDFFLEEATTDSVNARPSKAIWAMDLDDPENDKNLLKWLNGELVFLADESRERFRLMRRNIALYKGIQYETQDVRRDLRDRTIDRSRATRKIVVNHLFDLTQNRVSRLVKFKPAVAVLPTNTEFDDQVAAQSTEQLLNHIWYIQNFEGEITPEVATVANVLGESYLFITWNPEKGDLHPDSPNPDKQGQPGEADLKKVPLLDANNKQAKDMNGNPIWIERPVRVGDVEYEVVFPWEVYLQRKKRLKDVEYCYRRKIMTVEEARLKYPDAANKIKESDGHEEFDFETFTTRKLVNEVIVYDFYHKSVPGLNKGRHIVFTRDAILANGDLPYSHGELPFERLTDIDIPGHLHGHSFFETVKALTSTYNNITNLIQRNQFLVSHPKWMVPAGAVKMESLGNDITVVQYKGPQPPVLAQQNPTPPETFRYRQELKEEFQQIAGVFGVSRGEPPPGIKAGVALQFLNEQEAERFNQSILKWNEFIRRTAIKTLSVAGDFYDTEDQRMMRVLGKNEQWKTVFFDAANLSKPYDIRIQNSSALPQSKAARVQTLLDLSERFPDQFTSDQVLSMLDLGQADKFVDDSTISIQTAQAENDSILNGGQTAGVREYEDHIAHWKEHVKALHEYRYKEMVPKNIQEKFEDHILVTEMFMDKKAKESPAFAEKLLALDLYPLFFKTQPAAVGGESPEEAPVPAGGAQGLPAAEGLPVNPELGGEAQQPVQEALPPLDNSPTAPEPGPIEPTRGI